MSLNNRFNRRIIIVWSSLSMPFPWKLLRELLRSTVGIERLYEQYTINTSVYVSAGSFRIHAASVMISKTIYTKVFV